MEAKFDQGMLVMTAGIEGLVCGITDYDYGAEVAACLNRHICGDWGDLDEEDKQMNDEALIKGQEDRILSAYDTTQGRIWIITEWDRSATTILLPGEY